MTEKIGRGVRSRVRVQLSASGYVEPGVSAQESVPYRINSYDMNPWHVEDGWPVAGAGTARTADVYDITPVVETHPAPNSVTTNAWARWTGSGWSGGTWSPQQGSGTWTGTGSARPTYKYKRNGVSYNVPGVRLDSDDTDYLTADLRAAPGNGYSFILVFKPFGFDKSDDDEDDETTYGLIAPATPATGQPELRVRNDKLFIKQSPELTVRKPYTFADRSFQYYMNRGAPTFLAWCTGSNNFHLYVGEGPSSLERYRLFDPHDLRKIFNFRLGSHAANTDHTADMILFDVGFYNEGLTRFQVASEVAILAAAYGGK